jgi:hypothetical protein
VIDEIRYLHLGNEEEREFFSFTPTDFGLSFQDDFEAGTQKIAGLSIFRSLDKTVIQRSTYDLLAFLGDVGGLEGIIMILGSLIASKLTSLSINLQKFA